MRDYIITLMVFGSLPLILKRPFFGILVWTWLGLMNPHKLCWGFATTMPFAQIVALTMFASLIINRELKPIPWTALSTLLALFWAFMLFTTFFAINQVGAWHQWDKVWKIMLVTFLAIMLLNSRERIDAMVWVMMLSLGYYGIKGGIFTILTGGGYHVYGPAGSFIGGNNEVGLALIMTVPLIRYLQLQAQSAALKYLLLAAIALVIVSIFGTQSRGAFLGLAAMATYLIIKSRNKAPLLLALAIIIPLTFAFMPDSWTGRMATIETYQEDRSAMGRINAWWTAYYLALDRPWVGGGFETMTRSVYAQYAPDPTFLVDVHSIYFEVLAEHGFPGLGLFLAIGLTSLITLNRISRFARRHEDLSWMRDLSSMLYVSLVGYAVSGAFLGLAYFNFYYALVAVVIGMDVVRRRYVNDAAARSPTPPAEQAQPPTDRARRMPSRAASPFARLGKWFNDL